MTEMVERVANAIRQKYAELNIMDPIMDVDPVEIARAAIEAMREPTDDMWDACGKAQADFETGIGWHVMIDAALATSTPAGT